MTINRPDLVIAIDALQAHADRLRRAAEEHANDGMDIMAEDTLKKADACARVAKALAKALAKGAK